MNKFQFNGRIREATGIVTALAGRFAGHRALEARGKMDQLLGRALVDRGDRKEQFRRISEAHIQPRTSI